MKLYGDVISGNCYKVQLLLAWLQRRLEWAQIDLAKGQNGTDDFLRINPTGEIPVLELDDGRHIAESNAILCYLAGDSEFLPSDSFVRAQVLQWLFFEQNSHQPFVASARYIVHHLRSPAHLSQKLQEKIDAGYRSLDVLDRHLRDRAFFVGDQCTVADIALYAYTGYPVSSIESQQLDAHTVLILLQIARSHACFLDHIAVSDGTCHDGLLK